MSSIISLICLLIFFISSLISFVVFGSDVVTRYLEVPNMKGKNLREAVEFEVKELIQNGEDYYTNLIKFLKN